MIQHLTEETCANYGCEQKLNNGNNCGGWKAQKLKDGNWKDGYICKKCGTQSVPGTSQLRLYQQTQHYSTQNPAQHTTTNKTIQHKRQWNNLIATIQREEENKENTNTSNKMPSWNAVLNRMEENRKEEKE